MRIVVTGATGNVGTSVLDSLSSEDSVQEIVAIARRAPARSWPKTRFVKADVTTADLVSHFRGAAAVVHLAWLIQPARDEALTHRVNVAGSERVFAAVVGAKVPALVYASSVGAYSAGPKDRLVDETWPTLGIASSFYSRHKVAAERALDLLEAEQPSLRVVRMRPGLIFKASAASEIRRLFAGPLLPRALLAKRLVPVVPNIERLRFQAVHTDDVADAYRRAVLSDASGPFNVAADPVLGPAELARVLRARPVPLAPGLLRAGANLTFRLHLQPSEPGWLDMALRVPLLETARVRRELSWQPRHTAVQALSELIDGIGAADSLDTPPLARRASGPLRIRELLTGVGSR